ncbi:MAG: GLUG motif-containing protein [Phycisphaerales bacterium]
MFQGTPFTGVFDGNHHAISHVVIQGVGYLGLFGQLGEGTTTTGAEVKDLGVLDVNITGSGGEVAALVGCCGLTNTLFDLQWAVIARCHSTGVVRGGGAGGLVGANTGGSVIQCYSTAAVTGTIYSTGGLTGSSWGTITQCYAMGTVSGGSHVGGLVGHNMGPLTYCYSTGAVRGDRWDVGGLVGMHGGPGDSHAAGIASSCFWDIQTSGQTTSDGGTSKSTAEMQTTQMFLDAGWDFVGETANGTDDIWWILEGKDYPHLWWELDN